MEGPLFLLTLTFCQYVHLSPSSWSVHAGTDQSKEPRTSPARLASRIPLNRGRVWTPFCESPVPNTVSVRAALKGWRCGKIS